MTTLGGLWWKWIFNMAMPLILSILSILSLLFIHLLARLDLLFYFIFYFHLFLSIYHT